MIYKESKQYVGYFLEMISEFIIKSIYLDTDDVVGIPWKGNRYISTDFDTIAYRSKSPKPQDTNGLGLFVFCGWRFPHVERRKVRLCLPENEPFWGESRE